MSNLLTDLLQNIINDEKNHNKICFSFIGSKNATYSEFYKKVFEYAKKLECYLEKGSPVIIAAKMDYESICLIIACLISGIIPIIKSYDNNNERNIFKINKFLHNNNVFNTIISAFPPPLDEKEFMNCNIININENKFNIKYGIEKLNNGFIFQETSGTTSDSKLVLLTENQVFSSIKDADEIINKNYIGLSYLPISHIFGFIASIMEMLYRTGATYIMQPDTFKNNPNLFLDIIKEKKINFLCMTNFGFEHIIENFSPEKHYDLSSLTTIHISGDVIKQDLLKNFYYLFKNYGLSKTVFVPIYGMTEAAGIVCWNSLRDTIDEEPIEGIVSCGEPKHVKILFKDEKNIHPFEEGANGEILINSQNLIDNYYNVQNSDDFIKYKNEKYFCTGDTGLIQNGRLYVTGRKKNILIKNSNKYSVYALENAINGIKNAYKLINSYFAAFDNKIVLFQEINTYKSNKKQLDEVKKIILERIKKYYNLMLDDVVFIKPDEISKTQIGKTKIKDLIKKYKGM